MPDDTIDYRRPDLSTPGNGVYLELYHGRTDRAEDMEDWGTQGPIFGPYPHIHVTYLSNIILGDDFLYFVDDMVYYDGHYYGDWSVVAESAYPKGSLRVVPYEDAKAQRLEKDKPFADRSSVLKDWVMRLPLREQGTLLTIVRGCDLTPKLPLDSPEREIISRLRGAFLVPADERELDAEPGCFMSAKGAPDKIRISGFGHYPQHWVSHVMHAVEVLAYRHPHPEESARWLQLYFAFCKSLHVEPESFATFKARMSEDRIAGNNVVS